MEKVFQRWLNERNRLGSNVLFRLLVGQTIDDDVRRRSSSELGAREHNLKAAFSS